MNNTEKFTGIAGVYAASRPRYAEALFDRLSSGYGFAGQAVTDVGSGTGIFAEGLLKRGSTVYAVEPNNDMRAEAEARLASFGGFVSISGSAENTGLPDDSVYAVTAAQAFHWFDAERFRAECARVLKPGGYVAIAYNVRRKSHLHEAVAELNRSVCSSFRGFCGGMEQERIAAFFGGEMKTEEFGNDLLLDENTFIGRHLSSSYAPREGEPKCAEYIAGLRAIFQEYASGGAVYYPLLTRVYIGKIELR